MCCLPSAGWVPVYICCSDVEPPAVGAVGPSSGRPPLRRERWENGRRGEERRKEESSGGTCGVKPRRLKRNRDDEEESEKQKTPDRKTVDTTTWTTVLK